MCADLLAMLVTASIKVLSMNSDHGEDKVQSPGHSLTDPLDGDWLGEGRGVNIWGLGSGAGKGWWSGKRSTR